MSLKESLRRIGRVVLPYRCLVCSRPLGAGRLCSRCAPVLIDFGRRCPQCFSELSTSTRSPSAEHCDQCNFFPPLPERIRFLWSYEGRARSLIRCIKYRPSRWLCSYAGSCLATSIDSLFDSFNWDLIVPIPARLSSRQDRLFHQCALLAQAVGKKTGTPILLDALSEIGHRPPQASLLMKDRLRLLASGFAASSRLVSGKSILLVDDVITSGATTSAATQALLEAGAKKVDLLALARAPVWNKSRIAVALRTHRLSANASRDSVAG